MNLRKVASLYTKWYKRFTEDRENIALATTSITAENIERVKEFFVENHWITIKENAAVVEISIGSWKLTLSWLLLICSAKCNPLILIYSPHFSTSNFFPFTKLAIPMKGNSFDTIDEIKSVSQNELMATKKRAFQKCYKNWRNADVIALYMCLYGHHFTWKWKVYMKMKDLSVFVKF